MYEFKGFDDWIPIFRGGSQTDSEGRVHDGNALIDTVVATFNVDKHEPPVVIGHPVDNAPAYGWVEGLKKQGDLLLAKFKQVQPAFADMVKQGLFKKRSAAFYANGSLRHVGFLGAMPPAIKGLPDVAFTENDSLIFEFNEGKKEEMDMNFEEFTQKLKDLVVPAQAVQTPAEGLKTFSEADLLAVKKKAAEDAAKAEREKVTTEFAENARVARTEARRQEIASWCTEQVKAGKMTPAMVKFGVPEFMAAFAEKEDVIEFGEEKTKATLYDRFKTFFETELPKVVEFKEIATRDKDTGGQNGAGAKLTALVQQHLKKNKELTYSAAFSEVQRENPGLASEYAAEINQEPRTGE